MRTETTREMVRLLTKSVITRLENKKMIEFAPNLRQIVSDEVYGLIEKDVLTDEDLREKALEQMGARAEELRDTDLSQNEQFKTARSMLRKQFGEDEWRGFYFQASLKTIAEKICHYFMDSDRIDEVYESDEELGRSIIEMVKQFDPKQVH